jgi:hypothetical protein
VGIRALLALIAGRGSGGQQVAAEKIDRITKDAVAVLWPEALEHG